MVNATRSQGGNVAARATRIWLNSSGRFQSSKGKVRACPDVWAALMLAPPTSSASQDSDAPFMSDSSVGLHHPTVRREGHEVRVIASRERPLRAEPSGISRT